jgi:hypothetical protein
MAARQCLRVLCQSRRAEHLFVRTHHVLLERDEASRLRAFYAVRLHHWATGSERLDVFLHIFSRAYSRRLRAGALRAKARVPTSLAMPVLPPEP